MIVLLFFFWKYISYFFSIHKWVTIVDVTDKLSAAGVVIDAQQLSSIFQQSLQEIIFNVHTAQKKTWKIYVSKN